jgi:hypothetical protein
MTFTALILLCAAAAPQASDPVFDIRRAPTTYMAEPAGVPGVRIELAPHAGPLSPEVAIRLPGPVAEISAVVVAGRDTGLRVPAISRILAAGVSRTGQLAGRVEYALGGEAGGSVLLGFVTGPGGLTLFRPPQLFTDSWATSISASGVVGGVYGFTSAPRSEASATQIPRGFVYQRGRVIDVGPAEFVAVDDAGKVAGSHPVDSEGKPAAYGGLGVHRAFRIERGQRIELGEGKVTAIGAGSRVVGYLPGNVRQVGDRITVGEEDEGAVPLVWLGTQRRELPLPARVAAAPWSLNERGDIVGGAIGDNGFRFACLWMGGRFYDLNRLAVMPPGWHLVRGLRIDDRGRILCEGSRGDARMLFELVPGRVRR